LNLCIAKTRKNNGKKSLCGAFGDQMPARTRMGRNAFPAKGNEEGTGAGE